MKSRVTYGKCAQRASELGFRSPQVGSSYLFWAMNCPSTNLDEYIAELRRNQPSLFTRASREHSRQPRHVLSAIGITDP
jgi:hypothetical protein